MNDDLDVSERRSPFDPREELHAVNVRQDPVDQNGGQPWIGLLQNLQCPHHALSRAELYSIHNGRGSEDGAGSDRFKIAAGGIEPLGLRVRGKDAGVRAAPPKAAAGYPPV